jgi:plastocyanin
VTSRSLALKSVWIVGVLAFALTVTAAGFISQDAGAAGASVTTGSPTNRFSPNIVNVNIGDNVSFNWSAGIHVVRLRDSSPDLPIDAGHPTGTTNAFTSSGTFYFYCIIHASEALATEAHVQANDAMVGKVVVAGASGSPTAAGLPQRSFVPFLANDEARTAATSSTPTPTPTPTRTPPATPTQTYVYPTSTPGGYKAPYTY